MSDRASWCDGREGRGVIHRCTTTCVHGGPIYVRWPFKTQGSILEDWPADSATHMPPGIAISMGATVELLAAANSRADQ